MGYYFIYFLTNSHNDVIYCGITRNLVRRMNEHRSSQVRKSFSYTYNAYKLIYYELFQDPRSAIAREKQIKGGSRKKKVDLVNKVNPNWDDLFDNETYGIASLRSQ